MWYNCNDKTDMDYPTRICIKWPTVGKSHFKIHFAQKYFDNIDGILLKLILGGPIVNSTALG